MPKAKQLVVGVNALNSAGSRPVPIREFCARPENVKLDGICK
ncbi:hypothetical protein [Alkalilimnicola sp. S0819]|nr:hypothetical protein [Alkalilimnicola sp. S0819]